MSIQILNQPQINYISGMKLDLSGIKIVKEVDQKPSQIIFNDNYIIDLTNDGVNRKTVLNGVSFHDQNGQIQNGTLDIFDGVPLYFYDSRNNKYKGWPANYVGSNVFNNFPYFDTCTDLILGGPNINSISHMFYNSNLGNTNTNGGILIGEGVTNCDSVFCASRNFNNCKYIKFLGNNITTMNGMFAACNIFNSPVYMPENLAVTCTCSEMFRDANSFNQPINIPYGVNNTFKMFRASSFHQNSITIPQTVMNCSNMFGSLYNCYGMNFDVYIKRESTPFNCVAMFNGCANMKVRIYCNNLSLINNTTNSITHGVAITWTPVTNGYYNFNSYNNMAVYLYNNLPEDI